MPALDYATLGRYLLAEYGEAIYGLGWIGGLVPKTLSVQAAEKGFKDATGLLSEGVLSALGQLPGVIVERVQGYRAGLDGTQDSIRGDGEAVHPSLADWATAPGELTMVSTSANDDGDPGAGAVKIVAWTTAWERVILDSVLNGTTEVDIDAGTDYWHASKIWVAAAGSGGANAGAVKVDHENATASILSMAAGDNVSEAAQLWIPPTHYGLVRSMRGSIQSLATDAARIRLYRRDVEFASDYLSITATGVWRPIHTLEINAGQVGGPLEVPLLVEPGTQLDARAIRTLGVGDPAVAFDAEVWLIPKAVVEEIAAEVLTVEAS